MKYLGPKTNAANLAAQGDLPIAVSSTPPAGASEGDLWLDSDTGRLYCYYDAQWINPASVGRSVSTAAATTITGTNSEGTSNSLARADHNHALGTGVVGTAQIADDAVTGAKISVTPSWTAPTLNTGWENYNIAWETAAYYKDRFGFVHLRGMVARSSGTEITIFTLPSGSRPPLNITFPIIGANGAGRLTITGSGNVVYESGGTTWYSLNGVYFRT